MILSNSIPVISSQKFLLVFILSFSHFLLNLFLTWTLSFPPCIPLTSLHRILIWQLFVFPFGKSTIHHHWSVHTGQGWMFDLCKSRNVQKSSWQIICCCFSQYICPAPRRSCKMSQISLLNCVTMWSSKTYICSCLYHLLSQQSIFVGYKLNNILLICFQFDRKFKIKRIQFLISLPWHSLAKLL